MEELQKSELHQQLVKKRPSIISFFNEDQIMESTTDESKREMQKAIPQESKKIINEKCFKKSYERFTVNKVPEFQVIFEDTTTPTLENKNEEFNPDIENIQELNQLCINFSKKKELTDLDDSEYNLF